MTENADRMVLGLDLGSNSVGWALLKEDSDGKPVEIVDLGVRIFTKAVEDQTPTPKNQARRSARLSRRVLRRRAHRRQRMIRCLIERQLLPQALLDTPTPEVELNAIGDPYELRHRALSEELEPCELGRVLLHFAARRGFLSNRKNIAEDLKDDREAMKILSEMDKEEARVASPKGKGKKKEGAEEEDEGAVLAQIANLQETLKTEKATLGAYLHSSDNPHKRNRTHSEGSLRTERSMYRKELEQIWEKQKQFFPQLNEDFIEQVKKILFSQRPIRFDKSTIGNCELEPRNKRAKKARLEFQEFRSLQTINHMEYRIYGENEWQRLTSEERNLLIEKLEQKDELKFKEIKEILGLNSKAKINFEEGENSISGNITAQRIRRIIGDAWDNFDADEQLQFVEDLLSFHKKSALKKRLMNHWKFSLKDSVQLCVMELDGRVWQPLTESD